MDARELLKQWALRPSKKLGQNFLFNQAVLDRIVAAAELSADDVVRVMWRAGFSDDQVLELGTDLRNSLAYTGAAQIVIGERVEAVFGMDGDYLYVASRMRGSFIYDLGKRDFR